MLGTTPGWLNEDKAIHLADWAPPGRGASAWYTSSATDASQRSSVTAAAQPANPGCSSPARCAVPAVLPAGSLPERDSSVTCRTPCAAKCLHKIAIKKLCQVFLGLSRLPIKLSFLGCYVFLLNRQAFLLDRREARQHICWAFIACRIAIDPCFILSPGPRF